VNVLLDALGGVVPAQALGPGAQEHLLHARQMQALSFAAHIPLVCFGIAFPLMVLATSSCAELKTALADLD
jgi:hypothetical protein